jgi:SAM-dependent methyltransferase
MSQSKHWENVYENKQADDVSWFQPTAGLSRELIMQFAPGCDAAVADVGAGSSPLVGELVAQGYRHVDALDFSRAALAQGRARAGESGALIRWRHADLTQPQEWPEQIDVWHDRALFHFLNTRAERRAYVENAYRAVKPGGVLIVAAFSLEGPPK